MNKGHVGSSTFHVLAASLWFMPLALLAQVTAEPSPSHATQFIVPIQSAFRGNPVGLIWTIVLIAFATASFVQLAKDFLRWRYRFHQRMVRNWVHRRTRRIRKGIVDALDAFRYKDPHDVINEDAREQAFNRHSESALNQLEDLAGAEHYFGFSNLPAYSLPAEQLCGQLAAAAELAVATPEKFEELFAVLTAVDESIPVEDFKQYLDARKATRDQAQTQRSGDELSPSNQLYGELRSQFMMQAQRALDNLQIKIGEIWRRQVMVTCLAFSLVFACIVVPFLVWTDPVGTKFPLAQAIVTTFVITIAGALLAPVTHDLMRAVRSFRR